MKILHVWNQAGVASILAKYQNKLGCEAHVIKRVGYDKYGIEKYYGTNEVNCSPRNFYSYLKKITRAYDIIHLHSQVKALPFLPKKRVVLHFHGTELRQMSLLNKMVLKCFSPQKILVSTPDLLCLQPKAEYLPNPVDTELFFPRKLRKKTKFKFPLPYLKMPFYLSTLNKYKECKAWYISKTALESLACDVPVEWNGLTINPPLPKQNNPMNVAKKILQIYMEL